MAIPGKILNPASHWSRDMQTSHFSRSHSSCIHSGQHGSCTYITTDMHEYRKLSAERLGGQIGCGSAAGSAAAADRGEWSGSGSGHAHTATMGAPVRRMSTSRAPRSRRNPAKGRASSAASILRRTPNAALVAATRGSQTIGHLLSVQQHDVDRGGRRGGRTVSVRGTSRTGGRHCHSIWCLSTG